MTKSIPLTVAIPTYNRCQSVEKLIRSILPQLNPEDELLVIDDCSQDSTVEDLAIISQVRLVSHPSNQGMVKTWNHCLTEASHDWICMVHDDDMIADDALKTIRKACLLINQPALIGSKSLETEVDHAFRCRIVEPGSWSVLQAFSVPSGVTIHRAIVDTLGGFNEQFTYSPDLEYFSRVCAKYPVVAIENPQIIFFNLHSNNYEYVTWSKPDFLAQLEKIEAGITFNAGLEGDAASQLFYSRMNGHIAHILQYASRSSNKLLLKQFSLMVQTKPYLNRRNRLKANIAAILNWVPYF